ncbi:MAG: S1C family serine protease [Myxococcota bacterium]
MSPPPVVPAMQAMRFRTALLVVSLTGAAAAQTAAPPAANAPSCGPDWVAQVHQSVGSSVAKIEAAGGLGAGFVYHSPQYVATALHVVESGRTLTVTFGDGRQTGATVVAVDEEHDLAILQLHDKITAAMPLEPASEPPIVGASVVAIGHPFGIVDQVDERLEGLLTWSVTAGVVSARSERWIQTDAAINPGNSGGPLLDCEGRVLGVVSEKLLSAEGISLAVSVQHLEALRKEIGKQPVYTGSTTFGHPGLGMAIVAGDDRWLGISFGLGVVHADRWAFRLDAAYLWGVGYDEPSPLVRHQGSGMIAELGVYRRLLLFERPIPFYVIPGVGGSAFKGTIERRDIDLAFSDPTCVAAGEPCATTATERTTEETDRQYSPFAALGLSFGGLHLSYAYHLDVGDISASNHRILLGLGY